MATIDNILTLIEKGYSKSEIDNILSQNETKEPEPEDPQEVGTDSQEVGTDSQEVGTESQEVGSGDPSPLDILTEQVAALAQQVQTMTAAVQLQNSRRAEAPAGNNEMTAQDFLAQLINPHYKEDK